MFSFFAQTLSVLQNSVLYFKNKHFAIEKDLHNGVRRDIRMKKKSISEALSRRRLQGHRIDEICTVICLVDFISNCHFHGFHGSDS